GRAWNRARSQVSRCRRDGLRPAPQIARLARGSWRQVGTCHHFSGRSTSGRTPHFLRLSRCPRRGCYISVNVTRINSGLVVVTDAMAHLKTSSLGVWVGAGSRDEQPDEHGISHLLEHMAFKGTSRRTARQIAEEIEAVGGDLNAATSVET